MDLIPQSQQFIAIAASVISLAVVAILVADIFSGLWHWFLGLWRSL